MLVAVLLAVLGFAGAAWAAELEGKVQSVDADARTIVLDDGTTLAVAEGVSIEGLKEGTDVKVSYEERDGRNVATSVEAK
jgi:Cu/Ag efflux protein CusF